MSFIGNYTCAYTNIITHKPMLVRVISNALEETCLRF